jgi:hypothetical protein
MSQSIRSGGLTVKDPNSAELFVMDWDEEHLETGVTIASSSWSITGADSVLTSDQASVLAGSRKTQVRLSAGTVGGRYTVTNRIVTNESPAQTKDASFKVLIQDT